MQCFGRYIVFSAILLWVILKFQVALCTISFSALKIQFSLDAMLLWVFFSFILLAFSAFS